MSLGVYVKATGCCFGVHAQVECSNTSACSEFHFGGYVGCVEFAPRMIHHNFNHIFVVIARASFQPTSKYVPVSPFGHHRYRLQEGRNKFVAPFQKSLRKYTLRWVKCAERMVGKVVQVVDPHCTFVCSVDLWVLGARTKLFGNIIPIQMKFHILICDPRRRLSIILSIPNPLGWSNVAQHAAFACSLQFRAVLQQSQSRHCRLHRHWWHLQATRPVVFALCLCSVSVGKIHVVGWRRSHLAVVLDICCFLRCFHGIASSRLGCLHPLPWCRPLHQSLLCNCVIVRRGFPCHSSRRSWYQQQTLVWVVCVWPERLVGATVGCFLPDIVVPRAKGNTFEMYETHCLK